MGELDQFENRFLDSKRIEGTLPDMLDEAIAFVRTNMRIATRIDSETGERIDIPQYPIPAVREAILNALVHRDYSFHTEGKPIQLIMFSNRMEIVNPGGLYGRLTIDQLGRAQPDTRNPVLVTAMETLKKTENRYSGIPTIRRAMEKRGLPDPVFINTQGTFKVVLRNDAMNEITLRAVVRPEVHIPDEKGLIEFCRVPRTRTEIIQHLNIASSQYALRRYLDPLIQAGKIRMTKPQTPRSKNQIYITAKQE